MIINLFKWRPINSLTWKINFSSLLSPRSAKNNNITNTRIFFKTEPFTFCEWRLMLSTTILTLTHNKKVVAQQQSIRFSSSIGIIYHLKRISFAIQKKIKSWTWQQRRAGAVSVESRRASLFVKRIRFLSLIVV